MSSAKQFVLLFVTYTALIVGTMYWSGLVTEKTLYDQFIINLDSVLLPISDTHRSIKFYTDVMDFAPIHKDPSRKEEKKIVGFELSSGKKLLLEPESSFMSTSGGSSKEHTAVVIRVRNGFEKLHQRLVTRSGDSAFPVTSENILKIVPPGRISQIVHQPWGDEFVITDPDGNHLIFYMGRRRSSSRY